MTKPNNHPASPSLAYGALQWGGAADATAARAMYDACRAAGISHFDTAVGYADGASATLLGQFAAADRASLTIATKVGFDGGCSAVNIATQFDLCRQQLQMDRIDLLYLHRWDADTPLEETFTAVAALQQSGAIGQIGISNYAAWQVMKAQAVCATLGTRIDAIQPMYNLVKRQAEVELLPMAVDQGLAIYPYSPLGGGLLTGKYAQGGTGRLDDNLMYAKRYGQAQMHDTASALAGLAADLGSHPATLAVAWVMAHSATPVPLISARSLAQLAPSLAAADFAMTPDLYARIAALSPTPAPATDRSEEA